MYWSQKARVQWLREGDSNIAYFQATVKGRRCRNRIRNLQREDRTWCENEQEVCNFYRNFSLRSFLLILMKLFLESLIQSMIE